MSKQPSGYPRYAPAGYPQQLPQQQQQQQQQQQYYQPAGMVPPMYPSGYVQPQSYVSMNQPMQLTSSPYGIPPPPYTSTPQQMYSQSGPQPTYSLQHAQASQMGMMPSQHHGGMVVQAAQGSYDAGARFGAGATHNIPPPPPGCQANQAQLATAQGRPVVMRQNPDSWISGGSDGGYTVW